jgi:outer membrane protein assembly factor BamB
MLKRIAIALLIATFLISPLFAPKSRAQSGDGARQNITWINAVNCAVNANNLQKTGGRTDTADAGARSLQTITAGDAYLEFTVSEANKLAYCGLAHSAIGTDFNEIDFAIKLTELGVAEARENEVYKAEVPYRSGDIFRVADESGVVKYYHNGSLFYTSLKRPTYPLLADAVLLRMGARLDNAVIGALAVTAAADWKMYQRDSAHTANAVGSRIDTTNASTLTEAWRFTTGGWVSGTPVVANGVVYVGSWDGKMYALRESDGTQVWSFNAGTFTDNRCNPTIMGIDSTAAVADGKVYFATSDAKLYALDAATGNVVWQKQVADPGQAYHFYASPVVFDDKIYIGLASHCVNPCVRGEVVCVNASNGNIVWTFFTAPEGSLGGGVWSSCAIDPNRRAVYVGTGNFCSGEDTYSSAVLALNADSGNLIWSFKKVPPKDLSNFDFGASPILYDVIGIPMLAIGSKDGHCYALNRQTGELLWDTIITDGSSIGGTISSPAFANGLIFMGAAVQSQTGKVIALDARGGSKVWEASQPNEVIGATAVANGVVFIAGSDGTVRGYDAQTGNQLWSAVRANFVGGVSVTRDHLFVGSTNRNVYSFALADIVPQPRTSITVTSPSAGTEVKKGKKFDITWSIVGSVNRVAVMISHDGGSSWASLADSVDANTGSLRVKAKKPKSDAVIVRVTDLSNQATFGDSGTFRIR